MSFFISYSRNAISIRTGGTLPIEECRNVKTPKNDPNHWQTLCIEGMYYLLFAYLVNKLDSGLTFFL